MGEHTLTHVALTFPGAEWSGRWWWSIFQKVVWKWSWPRHSQDRTSEYLRQPPVQRSWSRTHLQREKGGDMVGGSRQSHDALLAGLRRGKHLSGCRRVNRRTWRAWRCTPSGRASGSPYCCRWQCRLHGTAGTHRHSMWSEIPQWIKIYIYNDNNVWWQYLNSSAMIAARITILKNQNTQNKSVRISFCMKTLERTLTIQGLTILFYKWRRPWWGQGKERKIPM